MRKREAKGKHNRHNKIEGMASCSMLGSITFITKLPFPPGESIADMANDPMNKAKSEATLVSIILYDLNKSKAPKSERKQHLI